MTLMYCWSAQCRYLPSRADNTRAEEIREILREMLDNDVEKTEFAKRFMVKRDAHHSRNLIMDPAPVKT
uniref:Uncharacterized protein n=1 Tax=Strigamia maritima TaxID=126957 RepID=T1JHF5_STRMM